jgi:hypothetical protein
VFLTKDGKKDAVSLFEAAAAPPSPDSTSFAFPALLDDEEPPKRPKKELEAAAG